MKKNPLLFLLAAIFYFPIGVIMTLTKNYR